MWVIFAILASVVWGLDYVFAEKLVRKISVSSFIALELFFGFLIALITAIYSNSFKKDFVAVGSSRQLLTLLILGIVSFTAGNFLILNSIASKNATLAGMVEISYPIFIAIFAYLLFKENQLNLATAIGGLLIFAGVFVIYYFNR
jgi:drug/metabolite transporter (DMT)-like permease